MGDSNSEKAQQLVLEREKLALKEAEEALGCIEGGIEIKVNKKIFKEKLGLVTVHITEKRSLQARYRIATTS